MISITTTIARAARRGPSLARPLSTTVSRLTAAEKLDKPGQAADISNNKSQHPDSVKRGNEPANDAELDPKKSSEGGAAGSASFARSTKEPDASKKPVSPGAPGTNKLD
ncbi:hypothetical protein NCC49_003632 [Naganishia albida]|nr:hypothetical protein NCC49_003632 [Naganishia albida]